MAIFNSYVSLPEGNPQLELPKWIPLVKDFCKKSSQSTAPFRPVTGALRHPDHLLPGPGPWNQTWGCLVICGVPSGNPTLGSRNIYLSRLVNILFNTS